MFGVDEVDIEEMAMSAKQKFNEYYPNFMLV